MLMSKQRIGIGWVFRYEMKIGVIADTHIPDRARWLNPRVLDIFQEKKVEVILHAGDVSAPYVLRQLEEVAPVYAVRGNRDWLWLSHLPRARCLEFAGVKVGLAHGHGGWKDYLADRLYLLFHDYQHEMLLPRLLEAFPGTRVIVFGHGHVPMNSWINGQLLFNPGSPHFPQTKRITPSLGILHLSAEGEVDGEILSCEAP